jgi:hypothetical protein
VGCKDEQTQAALDLARNDIPGVVGVGCFVAYGRVCIYVCPLNVWCKAYLLTAKDFEASWYNLKEEKMQTNSGSDATPHFDNKKNNL